MGDRRLYQTGRLTVNKLEKVGANLVEVTMEGVFSSTELTIVEAVGVFNIGDSVYLDLYDSPLGTSKKDSTTVQS